MSLWHFFPAAYAASSASAPTTVAEVNPIYHWGMILVLIGFFYLTMMRPQIKKAKQARTLIEQLKVGDEVATAGGLLGTLTSIEQQYVWLELSQGVRVCCQKQAIIQVLPKGTFGDFHQVITPHLEASNQDTGRG